MKKQLFLFLFLSSLCWSSLWGQHLNVPETTLATPYNTIYVHLYYLQAESYDPEKAAVTLFRSPDSTQNVQLAIQLKQILDGNGLFVRLNQLPQEVNYIDSLTQKPYYTPFPVDLPDVYLEKIDNQWLYSAETISLIPSLHKATYPYGTAYLLDLLPRLGHQRILGLALWQYFAIAVLLIIIWVLYKILSGILSPLVRRLLGTYLNTDKVDKKSFLKIAQAISLFLLVRFISLLVPVLQLPIEGAKFTIVSLRIVTTIILVLLAVRIIRLVMDYAMNFAESTEHRMDEQLIPIIRRILVIIFVLIGIVHILGLLDVNVTALIAGVSIGGLALALAAQDTVKNLIGSAMIFFDRPFQIGDYIVGSGFAGTVVEVGFRTTRIKTGDTSILSVPNGSVANMVVTNKGVRVFRLLSTELGLTYDTPPALIEKFTEGLKWIILNHPGTLKEDFYVNLSKMDASSLNIFFRVYLVVGGYADELRVKEEILLSILRLAESMGVRFAFPSSTVYVEDFPEKKSNVPVPSNDPAQSTEDLTTFQQDFRTRFVPPEA